MYQPKDFWAAGTAEAKTQRRDSNQFQQFYTSTSVLTPQSENERMPLPWFPQQNLGNNSKLDHSRSHSHL